MMRPQFAFLLLLLQSFACAAAVIRQAKFSHNRRAKTSVSKFRVFGDDLDLVKLKSLPARGDVEGTTAWLQHWRKPRTLTQAQQKKRAESESTTRYLTFETDAGGFNNMRMAFEYFVDLASRSGRTLVLPPAEGWYLIDWGPTDAQNKSDKHWLEGTPRSTYQEFWDIDYLSKQMNVMSAEQFFQREMRRFQIPESASPLAKMVNSPDPSPWKDWLQKQSCVDSCGDGSQKVFDDTPLVHFGCPRSRFFECLYKGNFMQSTGGDQARDMIHYNPKMFEIASAVVSAMGASQYTALHLRRNDFQFVQAPSAENLAVLLGDLQTYLKPDEPVYVSSDDIHEEWWQALESALKDKNHKLYRLTQFRQSLEKIGLTSRNDGLVEQIICAGARIFIGTPMSTFTAGIQLIRSQMGKAYLSESGAKAGASAGGTEYHIERLYSNVKQEMQ